MMEDFDAKINCLQTKNLIFAFVYLRIDRKLGK
jgi:hypothetical protein